MNILKWFNQWLTSEEEETLAVPSRRTFCIGALSTLALAAAPAGFQKLGNIYIPMDPAVLTPDTSLFTEFERGVNLAGFEDMPPSLYKQFIENVMTDINKRIAVPFEYMGTTRNPHNENMQIASFQLRREPK